MQAISSDDKYTARCNDRTDKIAIYGQSSRWVHRARWADSVNTEIGDCENIMAVAGHLMNWPIGERCTGGTLFHLSCGSIPMHHRSFISRNMYAPPIIRKSRNYVTWKNIDECRIQYAESQTSAHSTRGRHSGSCYGDFTKPRTGWAIAIMTDKHRKRTRCRIRRCNTCYGISNQSLTSAKWC